MLKATATVVKRTGTSALVACAGAGHCARCAAGNGCGGALMERLLGDRLRLVNVEVPPRLVLRAGDTVLLGLPEDAFLRGAMIVYLVPVLGLLLGAVLGVLMVPAGGDAAGLVGGGAGLLAALAVAKWRARDRRNQPRFRPVILSPTTP